MAAISYVYRPQHEHLVRHCEAKGLEQSPGDFHDMPSTELSNSEKIEDIICTAPLMNN